MIRKICHIPQCSKLFQKYIYPFSQTKMIRDSDELSIDELEDVLGHKIQSLSQSQKGITLENEKKGSTELMDKDENYFYGLMPLINQNYPQCIDPDTPIIQETPNQNLFKELGLPIDCSFAEYTSALSKYRTEVDLYGDEEEKSVIENQSLEFKQLLNPQSKYLLKARHSFMVNISIPGTIQCEDPRNFMELRPIEEFRHTPLVPISDSAMKAHKEMLQRYHRKQFVFEVSTESILNWSLVFAAVGVGSYMIYLIVQKEEQRTVAFSRLKYQRIVGESSQTPVFRI